MDYRSDHPHALDSPSKPAYTSHQCMFLLVFRFQILPFRTGATFCLPACIRLRCFSIGSGPPQFPTSCANKFPAAPPVVFQLVTRQLFTVSLLPALASTAVGIREIRELQDRTSQTDGQGWQTDRLCEFISEFISRRKTFTQTFTNLYDASYDFDRPLTKMSRSDPFVSGCQNRKRQHRAGCQNRNRCVVIVSGLYHVFLLLVSIKG